MTKQNLTPKQYDLLSRHVTGNLSGSEAAEVVQMLAESEAAREELRVLRSVWNRLDSWEVEIEDHVFQPTKLRKAIAAQKKEEPVPFGEKVRKFLHLPEFLPVSAWAGVGVSFCVLAFAAVQFSVMDDTQPTGNAEIASVAPEPIAVANEDLELDKLAEDRFRQILANEKRRGNSIRIAGGVITEDAGPAVGRMPMSVDPLVGTVDTVHDTRQVNYAALAVEGRF